MNLSDISKKVLSILVALLLLLILASIAYYRSFSFLPFAAGAFLGFLLNAFKVYMLDRAVQKSISMEVDNAGNFIRIQHVLRMLLTGLVLYVSAVLPFINLWGAVASIISFQLAIHSLKYINGFTESARKSEKKSESIPDSGGD